jgi:hypothetical protein
MLRAVCFLCLVAFGASAAVAQDDNAAGRAKLAEIVAFVRDASEPCAGSTPPGTMRAALALFVAAKPPLTEAEIATKQIEVQAYRARLGDEKWCQLYAVEMTEAKIVVESLSNQN